MPAPRRTVALLASVLVFVGLSMQTTPASAAPKTLTTADCVGLVGTTLPLGGSDSAVVTASAEVAANGTAPVHCDSTIKISGRITMDLRSPYVGWESRYAQVGGGGFCGSAPTVQGGYQSYLARQTAVASDDTGHTGSAFDATFGLNNPQAEADWGYLSEHLTKLAAVATLKALYGVAPTHSYFLGCSTGGRQALMSAQRYPNDFDGITAGAPANRQNLLAVLSQGYREIVNHDATGNLILNVTDANLLAAAVVQKCDGLDGLKDGVVGDPRTCLFDPKSLLCQGSATSGCLSPDKVAVARKWYDDPRDSKGTSMYPGGIPRGSESGWNLTNIIGPSPAYSFGGQFGDQVLKYLAFPTDPAPTYGIKDFNFDTDRASLLGEARKYYNSDNPDMSPFRDSGGKMILWHGFADPLITPFASIQYYEDGLSKMSGLTEVQKWYRFFLLPGVNHCSGGPGPDQVDWFSAIVDWVEHSKAPARVVASSATVTRPLFPYPMKAVYSGKGDVTQQASFKAVLGSRGRGLVVPAVPTSTTRTAKAFAPWSTRAGGNLAATGLSPRFLLFGATALLFAFALRRVARR